MKVIKKMMSISTKFLSKIVVNKLKFPQILKNKFQEKELHLLSYEVLLQIKIFIAIQSLKKRLIRIIIMPKIRKNKNIKKLKK